MLILSRQPGEKIMIGDDVEIIILDISGGQIKVGVTAPKDVVILREEVAVRDKGKKEEE